MLLPLVFKAVHSSTAIVGFCYTQLTDVEQEVNGLLTKDRIPKREVEVIRDIVVKGKSTTILRLPQEGEMQK